MTTRLPVVLENLRIATPCTADWAEMSGSDKVRFCGLCEKNVYNLSAMTREEAESLVQRKDGRMCVRLYQRHDGTVLTADCPVGVQRERLRQRVWARISGLAASFGLVLGLAGGRARADLTFKNRQHPVAQNQPVPPHPVMGGAVARPEPPMMGKVAYVEPKAKPPEPPRPVMGEPMPVREMMGDISEPIPPTPPKTVDPKPANK
jgi:hypothetical protein